MIRGPNPDPTQIHGPSIYTYKGVQLKGPESELEIIPKLETQTHTKTLPRSAQTQPEPEHYNLKPKTGSRHFRRLVSLPALLISLENLPTFISSHSDVQNS